MIKEEELILIFKKENPEVLPLVKPMIHRLIFISGKLDELEKYPFIKINPDNPTMQKTTEAAKRYKDFVSQEREIIRALCSIINKSDSEEGESPLRLYLKGIETR